jgi:tetratricopeptide (TPR) repeat protein
VLDQERRRTGGVGPGDLAPRTAWEHYAVGRCLLRRGDRQGAADCLGKAVGLDPGGLWPNFYRGQCLYHDGRYEEAVTAFSVCVGAAPSQPAPYVNRGRAYAALGRKAAAVADAKQALHLDDRTGAARQLLDELEAGEK